EEALHLRGRARPVVARERVNTERPDAHVRRVFDDALESGDARTMTGHAREALARRPAAVAIHDDGDVQARVGLSDRSGGNALAHDLFSPMNCTCVARDTGDAHDGLPRRLCELARSGRSLSRTVCR